MTLFLKLNFEGTLTHWDHLQQRRGRPFTHSSHPKALVPHRPDAWNKGSLSGEMSTGAQLQRKPGLRDTNWYQLEEGRIGEREFNRPLGVFIYC